MRCCQQISLFACALLAIGAIVAPSVGIAQPMTGPVLPQAGPRAGSAVVPQWGTVLRSGVMAGEGIGHNDSYLTLGLFQPMWTSPDSLWFFDVQGLVYRDDFEGSDNEFSTGANAGFGFRRPDPLRDGVLGVGVWYDVNASHRNTYQQISLGIESLGCVFDWRTNLYAPLGETRNVISDTGLLSGEFAGRRILFPRFVLEEQALAGIDAEIGGPIWGDYCGPTLSAFLGGYAYESEDASIAGGYARFMQYVTQDLSLQLGLFIDNEQEFRANFGFTWLLPVGRCKSCGPNHSHSPVIPHGATTSPSQPTQASVVRSQTPAVPLWRYIQPMQRNPNIVVTDVLLSLPVTATDPITGLPLDIVHVASGAVPDGDGTFEMPFQFLDDASLAAASGSVIFAHADSVFAGESIVLPSGVRFLGEGIDHEIATAEMGTILLPRATAGTMLPVIDGSPGNAITVADGTEVSGLVARNSTLAGIFADGVDGDVNINRNSIEDGTGGIDIRNSTGTFDVSQTNISGTSGTAFNVAGGSPTVNSSADITNSSGRAIAVTGTSGGAVTFDGGLMDDSGQGVLIENVEGAVTVNGGTLNNSVANAIDIKNSGGAIALNNLEISNPVEDGVAVENSNVAISGLTVTNAGQRGFDIQNGPLDRSVMLSGNTVNGAGLEAMRLLVGGPGLLDATVSGNNLSSTGDAFATSHAAAGGGLTLSFDGNTLTSVSGAGAKIDGSGGGVLLIRSLADNTVLAAAAGGLLVDTAIFDAESTAGIQTVNGGNTVIGSAGMRVTGDGLRLDQVLGSIAFDSVNIFNEAGTGLFIRDAAGKGGTFAFANSGGTIDTIGGPALDIDPVTLAMTFANVRSQDSPTFGIVLETVDGTLTIGTTTIINSGKTGIVVRNSGGLLADFGNTTITGTGMAGMVGHGVDLAMNNAGGHFIFSDLSISTDNGTGLLANDSGLIEFTAAPMIAAVGGAAVDITNTRGMTAGVDGWTFQSLQSTASPGAGLRLVQLVDPFAVTGTTAIDGAAGAGIEIRDGAGGATFADVVITNRLGTGIEIQGGNQDVTFGSTFIENPNNVAADAVHIADTAGGNVTFNAVDIDTEAGTGNGFNLVNNDATVNIEGGSLQGEAGTSFRVDGAGADVTMAADLTNSGGRAVDIQNRSGGTVDFNGNILNTGPGSGILISGSTAANTVNFNGAVDLGTMMNRLSGGTALTVDNNGQPKAIVNFNDLDIFTDGQIGIDARGGGMLNIAAGSVDTTGSGATAIQLDGITTDITLASVDADDLGTMTTAMSFNNVTGSFTVTGATNLGETGPIGAGIQINGGNAAFTFGDVNIDNRHGIGVEITGTNSPIQFGTTTIGTAAGATADAIHIANTTGGSVTFAGTEIDTTAGTSNGIVLVDNIAPIDIQGGSVNGAGGTSVIINGAKNQINIAADLNNDGGRVVDIQNRSGGTVDFNGNILNTGPGSGILIAGSTAANTVNFNGPVDLGTMMNRLSGGTALTVDNNGQPKAIVNFNDLDIFTDGQIGIDARGGGILNIAAGSVDTIGSGATAIQLDGITTDITLASVAADDLGTMTTAMSFNNVTGSFTVNGTTSLGETGPIGTGIQINGGNAAFTFNDVSIDNRHGIGVEITGTNSPIQFGTTTIGTAAGATADAIHIANTTGGSVTFAGTEIDTTAGTSNGIVLVDNVAPIDIQGGSVNGAGGTSVIINGAKNQINIAADLNNDGGRVVDIQNRSGGTVDFNGSILNTGAGSGILIAGSTAANTVNFNGPVDLGTMMNRLSGGTALTVDNNGQPKAIVNFNDLDIFTDGQIGIDARGGGILNIAAGSVDTIGSGATAIQLDGITTDITLASVAADDLGTMTTAMSFNNLTGSFTITGATNLGETGPIGAGIQINGGNAAYTFNDVNIDNRHGIGVEITGTNSPIQFGTTTIGTAASTTADAIHIANTTGGSVTFAGTEIDTTAGTSNGIVLVDNIAPIDIQGGSVNGAGGTSVVINGAKNQITIAADLNNDGGRVVDIQNRSGGMVDFNGSILNTGPGSGILIAGSTAANTVNFNGPVDLGTMMNRLSGGTALTVDNNGQAKAIINFNDLDIFTDGQIGIDARGGGILNIAAGSVDTIGSGATAIQLDGITTDITLASVAADDLGMMTTAMSFNNVTGSFTVNGTTSLGETGPIGAGIQINGGNAAYTFNDVNIDHRHGIGVEITGTNSPIQFGTTTIGTAAGATADAIHIANTTGGSVTFAGTEIDTTAGTSNGIVLVDNVAPIDIQGGSVNGAGGTSVVINGAKNQITIAADLNNDGGRVVDIQNRSGGTVDFNGNILNTGPGSGILIAGSTAANTVNFNGAVDLGTMMNRLSGDTALTVDNNGQPKAVVNFNDLDIFTDGQIGIDARGGGILNIAAGSVDTIGSGATAIQLDGITTDITLASVAADDLGMMTTAMSFNNVTGSFTVNGTTSLGETGPIGTGIQINGANAAYTLGDVIIDNRNGTGIDIAQTKGQIQFGAATIGGSGTAADAGVRVVDTVGGGIGFDSLAVNESAGMGVNLMNNRASFAVVGETTIDTASDTSINIEGGTGGVSFGDVQVIDRSGVGIRIEGGKQQVAFGGTTITGTAPFAGVTVGNTTGGSVAFGGLVINGSGAEGVRLADNTAAFSVAGPTVIHAATDTAIDIIGGTGGVAFGSVDVNQRRGAGIKINGGDQSILFGATKIDNLNNVALGAIEIANMTDGDVTFSSIDVNTRMATTDGVRLVNNEAEIDIQGGSLKGSTGTSFHLDGGSTDVNFAATLTNTAGRAIEIQNRAGGTVTFGGTVTNVDGGTGIRIAGSTGANTVDFREKVTLGVVDNRLRGDTALQIDSNGQPARDALVLFNELDIFTNGQIGIAAANGGMLTVGKGVLNTTGTGATGIMLDGMTAAIALDSVDVENVGAAHDGLVFNNTSGLVTVSGTTNLGMLARIGTALNINGGDATFMFSELNIGNRQAGGINIDGTGGQIMFGKTTISGNGPAAGVHVANTTGGSVKFNDALTINDSQAEGILLENNLAAFEVMGKTTIDHAHADSIRIDGGSKVTFGETMVTDRVAGGIHITNVDDSIAFGATTIDGGGTGTTGINVQDTLAGSSVTFGSVAVDGESTAVTGLRVANNQGSFRVVGPTEINKVVGDAIDLTGAQGNVMFGEVKIEAAGGDGINMSGATQTAGTYVFGDVEMKNISQTGLNMTGADATLGMSSLNIDGADTGIDLTATQNFRNVVIAGGGTIENVNTGVQLAASGSTADSANANFRFQNGMIDVNEGAGNFTIDARGLVSNTVGDSGTYNFTGTTFGDLDRASFEQDVLFVAQDMLGDGSGGTIDNAIGLADAETSSRAGATLIMLGALNFDTLADQTFDLKDDQTITTFANAGGSINLGEQPVNILGNFVGVGEVVDTLGVGRAFLFGSGGTMFSAANGNSINTVSIVGGSTTVSASNITGFSMSNAILTSGSSAVFDLDNVSGAVSINNNVIHDFGGALLNVNGGNAMVSLSGPGGLMRGSAINVRNTSGGSIQITNAELFAEGTAVTLDNNDAMVMLNNVDVTRTVPGNTAYAIDQAVASTGSIFIGGGSSIDGGSGMAFDIGAGSRDINAATLNFENFGTFDDSVIRVSGQSGGTISFGNVAINAFGDSGSDTAVRLQGTGGTVSFADLDIQTNNGSGLVASGITLNEGPSATIQTFDAGFNATALHLDGVTASDGTFNFQHVSAFRGASGVILENISSNSQFGTVDITDTTVGIRISNSAGSHSFGSGSSIFNAAGGAYRESGGTANVQYGGSITSTVAFDSAIRIENKSGGSTTFDGLVSTDINRTAVDLNNNSGGTINFNGGLQLETLTAVAFSAVGGGTVNVTGTSNVLDAVNATALQIENTNIGSSGVQFRNISSQASGGAGISLVNTGAGSFDLTGFAGIAGTGGSINNSGGRGIVLDRVNNASLAGVEIEMTNSDGISILESNNVTVSGMTIRDTIGGSADGIEVVSSTNVTLNGNQIIDTGGDGIDVRTNNGNPSSVTIDANTINSAGQNGISVTAVSGDIDLNGTLDNSVTGSGGMDFNSSAGGGTITGSILVNGMQQPPPPPP